MRVLYITTKSPLPINDGHSIRTYNLLKEVAKVHTVYLISFIKFKEEYHYRHELEKICHRVVHLPVPENESALRLAISLLINIFSFEPFVARKYHKSSMLREINKILSAESIDLVHLDMLPLCSYLDRFYGLPVILNEHNVESLLLRRRVSSADKYIEKVYFTGQQKRLERFEKRAVTNSTLVVTCSDDDRKILQKMAPDTRFRVVANGVDTDLYHSSGAIDEKQKVLSFIGGMNWFPNKDAIVWFDQQVFPEVIRAEPEVVLDLIGKADHHMKLEHLSNIRVHGFVDDVRMLIEKAAIVVVPIRIGGGTRLKVLEAMSMGKAIVSTSVGVEGIKVEHRKNVLLADSPSDFVSCIHELLNDTDLRQRLGQAARDLVVTEYKWQAIGSSLLVAYEEAVALCR